MIGGEGGTSWSHGGQNEDGNGLLSWWNKRKKLFTMTSNTSVLVEATLSQLDTVAKSTFPLYSVHTTFIFFPVQ